MEDKQIIELYFERSDEAIAETDKKYGDRCRRTAFNILRSREDSEECTNDTYLKLWNTIPPKEPSPLSAFIARIVRNLALDRVKYSLASKRADSNYSVAYDELSECVPSPENVERVIEAKELTGKVEEFLDKLGKEKKTIFLMRYWNFCTVPDIARELGIGESKVKVTLMRTRAKLKEYLEKEGLGL